MSTYADSKHGNKHEKSSSPVNMLESHKQIKSANMKNITAASMLQPHQKSKSVNMKNITAASMLQTHQRTYPEPFRFPYQAKRIKSVNMKNITAASMLQPHQKSKSVNMKYIPAVCMLQTYQRIYLEPLNFPFKQTKNKVLHSNASPQTLKPPALNLFNPIPHPHPILFHLKNRLIS